ncbi:MAG: Crp/Fnr family transcriptional regulator [Chitinophagaceae bacterium]|nr:Crp/Fnr family transcriptional regulator [Chitinophagaceae bacterium]
MKTVLLNEKIKFSYIKNHLLFRHLDEEEVRDICSMANLINLKANKPFQLNSNASGRVFFLGNGTAKIIQITKTGKRSVKDILVGGEVFGDVSLTGSNTDGYVVGLKANTYIFYFDSCEFRKMLCNNHLMSLNYMELISSKLRYLEAKHSLWTTKDARFRLLYFFRGWALCTGTRTEKSVILENYFTLIDIAEFIGVTRQFIYTLLNELKEDGLINYSRKQVEVNKLLLQKDIEKTKNLPIHKVSFDYFNSV